VSGKEQVDVASTQRMMETLFSPRFADDPYAFVLYAYPWGEKGTRLEKRKGPRVWQREVLEKMRDHIAENKGRVARGEKPELLRIAISSGRGPGKSALVSWLSHWMISCHPGSTTQISANTEPQLEDKTFAELRKWLTLAINGYWFEATVRKISPAKWYSEALNKQLKIDSTYFYVNGVLWDEDNPAAFAGIHSDVGVMLMFDEASGIPQPIWTESEGFFTEATIYRFWLVFSNPRRNTGPFHDCFHEHRELWWSRKINVLDVEDDEFTDKKTYLDIIEKYGKDSDEAKVHVYGDFPNQSDHQFIPSGLVAQARYREYERMDDSAALVMGVDPARYGSDATVIRFRRGRDARVIPPIEMRKADNMAVANRIAELIEDYAPDAVFVDAGAGAGIIDRLKEMGFKHIFEVGFGTTSNDAQYFDHRTELWARMKEWLVGAMIDSNQKLLTDLCAPEWKMMGRECKIKLESKEDMRKRKVKSPDHADALAVTFHCAIVRKDIAGQTRGHYRRSRIAKGVDYDVFTRKER
jgi:hypothetical protein